ncbi:MAG: hypothetical protein J1F60_03870 [Oscillospiraceae bacterium]|nr:hypothetical protein [Oscillospiraceae bacterium]
MTQNIKYICTFFASNNNKSDDIDELIKAFNADRHVENCLVSAEYYGLENIYELYYGKNYREDVKFTYPLGTINKGTFASLREEYGIEGMYEAYYIVTPVYEIYKMLIEANEKNTLYLRKISENI